MEAPEYLDLDEIDFSDEISYSVTSLKTIPELCRRCDSQNEDRSEGSPFPSPQLICHQQKEKGWGGPKRTGCIFIKVGDHLISFKPQCV
uniref:Synuclein alpha interacting protein n=1 Tax=Monodelphis domestica TaxID=13616 RepID=A0A5F8GWR9_MONDO